MDKPEETDVQPLEPTPSEMIEEAMEQPETSDKDVPKETEESVEKTPENLDIADLNNLSGRNFENKDEFVKHYKNLSSLVGDQKRIETEKKAEEGEKATKELEVLQAEVTSLRDENSKSAFLKENPEAEKAMDHLRVIAKDKSISLEDAWNGSDAGIGLKDIVEVSPKPSLGINRLNPNKSTAIKKLAEQAITGDIQAQEALVAETLGLNNGNR